MCCLGALKGMKQLKQAKISFKQGMGGGGRRGKGGIQWPMSCVAENHACFVWSLLIDACAWRLWVVSRQSVMHVILLTQMLDLPKSVNIDRLANTSANAAGSSYQKTLSAVPADNVSNSMRTILAGSGISGTQPSPTHLFPSRNASKKTIVSV